MRAGDQRMPTDPENKPEQGTPRWVKVFGAIAVVLVVVFLVAHLAGGGMHGHH
jgi:hypothetical protein